MTSIEEFLSRLEGVKKVSNESWMALCPAHDDKNPSLSIQLADDRILIHCFAGCSPQTIVRALGLEMKDLFLKEEEPFETCLLYTSPSPRDRQKSRMPSSA